MENPLINKRITRNTVVISIGIFISLFLAALTTVINPFLVIVVVASFFLIFILFEKPKLYFIFVFGFIILFPKVSLINIPGTYVGIRGEDFLALLSIIFVTLFVLLKRKGNIIIPDKKMIKILGIYLIICFLSIIYGMAKNYIDSPLVAFMFLFRKIEYFSFIIFGYLTIRSEKDNKTIIRVIDITLVPILIIGLLQSLGLLGAFTLGNYVSSAQSRIVSVFSGPWEYSGYLVLLTPIYLTRLLSKKSTFLNKLYSLCMIGVIAYSLFLTQARISILAFMFLVLFFIVKSKKIILITFSFAIMILVATLFDLTEKVLPERFNSISISAMVTSTQTAFKNGDYHDFLNGGYNFYAIYGDGDLSFNMRISKWADLLNGVAENPLLGLGLSTTTEAVDGNYVRYLAESGILGFIFWVLLIVSVFKLSKKNNKVSSEWYTSLLSKTLYFGVISLLIMAIFIDIFEASKIAMFLWMLVGISLKSLKLNQQLDKSIIKQSDDAVR